jgi:type VI secretion system protein ImpE
MKTQDYYEAGQLREAIQAATDDVKSRPTDVGKRTLLAELLCFAGDLDRADKQLDAVGKQQPEAMLVISMFRHLVRAEMVRRDFYESGRVPEFIDKPRPELELRLQASIRIREGDLQGAAELLGEAEAQRPAVAGVANGKPFDDLRDLDDLCSSFFEVLTSNGKYYWIPIDRVELVELRPPTRPRELLWRPARMVVRGGPDGEVFLPTLYAGSHAEEEEDITRLGRFTDWRGGDDTPVRGVGQRMFLCGESEQSILEFQELTIDNPSLGDTDDESSA